MQNAALPKPATSSSIRNIALLVVLTLVAFVIMGYHPGLEDDSFYLAAVKRDLNPALFPHDSEFFRLQFQATIFDKLIAASVRLTHLPLAWMVLVWQLAAIFLILYGCLRIARRCLAEPRGALGRDGARRSAAHAASAGHRHQSCRSISSSAKFGDGGDPGGDRCGSRSAPVGCSDLVGHRVRYSRDHGRVWHFVLHFSVVVSAPSAFAGGAHRCCTPDASGVAL